MDAIYNSHHRAHTTDRIRHNGSRYLSEEVPARANAIYRTLRRAAWITWLPIEDFGPAPILAVHSAPFVQFLQTAYQNNRLVRPHEEAVFPNAFAVRGSRLPPAGFAGQRGMYACDPDTPIVAGTWQAAYWSAQCALTGAGRVIRGSPGVYALCRPPGHHAAGDLYGGFCYLNNAAIAARWLSTHGRRVAILDIDYHHGNGTQEIFWADGQVFYGSLHVDPQLDYPYYWGSASERGAGPGRGSIDNHPLPLGTDDATYLRALEDVLATMRAFQPDVLVVSAGFDIVAGDPIGKFAITLDGLHATGRHIAALGYPTLIVQEGGYRIKALGVQARTFLSAFE